MVILLGMRRQAADTTAMMRRIVIVCLSLAAIPWVAMTKAVQADTITNQLQLPPGFAIAPFAMAPGARSLVVVPQLDVLFVSTRGDTVYAVPLNDDDDLRPTYPVLTGLNVANGIAWKDGYLYVAEQHRLTRYFAPSLDALATAKAEVLYDRLPDYAGHGWRYIAFAPGPDGTAALYVGVGAPCNVCTTKGLEGTLTRFDGPRFDQPTVVASGVRNTVGFDVQPKTGRLYFTDNGADGMGDDSPPDEMNVLDITSGPAVHYGFPWYGGGSHRTPQMGLIPAPESQFPVVQFQAHVAALGVDFYAGRNFPSAYQGDAFVAQHGSWNRSSKVGYQVVRVRFDDAGNALSHEPFITGWLRPDGRVIGRPVDVEELPDGSLLISDDAAGRIYRVTYTKP